VPRARTNAPCIGFPQAEHDLRTRLYQMTTSAPQSCSRRSQASRCRGIGWQYAGFRMVRRAGMCRRKRSDARTIVRYLVAGLAGAAWTCRTRGSESSRRSRSRSKGVIIRVPWTSTSMAEIFTTSLSEQVVCSTTIGVWSRASCR
jgi:hypothetical protein